MEYQWCACAINKMSEMSTDVNQNLDIKESLRSERKKAKELEIARKEGSAPPQVDEEGRDINPHIPHYIASVPWYYGADKPTLKHQKDAYMQQRVYSDIHESYIKGVPIGDVPLKFKPGSCQNCGSISHSKKDCMERPRKFGAQFTNKDLKPADYKQPSLKLDFDGKRDRWAGYDASAYHKVVEEYDTIEMTKQKLKAQKLEEDIAKGTSSTASLKVAGFHGGEEDEDDDDKYADTVNMPGQKYDSKQRATIRNLRIREDTAKYLYNLDPGSAFYDPKTRSMRENPLKDTVREKTISFKGENATRCNGDVHSVNEAQLFTVNAYEKGLDVHLQADPTKAEILLKQFKIRKDTLQTNQQKELLSKYGGEEFLYAPPKEMLFGNSEEYVEYSRTGKVIKGQERSTIRSKYIEDEYTNNHTSVWGSYWEDFKWGYACCKSFIKNSYCIGLIQLEKQENERTSATSAAKLMNDQSIPIEFQAEKKLKKELNKKADKSKIKKIGEENNESKTHIPNPANYTVMYDEPKPTEEQMEEYMVKRSRDDDPLKKYLD